MRTTCLPRYFLGVGNLQKRASRLALVCIFQCIEGLTDRQAAEAVQQRIDWKYALALELSDPGFDFSVLSRISCTPAGWWR
jgi:transposase